MVTIKKQAEVGWENSYKVNYSPKAENIFAGFETNPNSHSVFYCEKKGKEPFGNIKGTFKKR